MVMKSSLFKVNYERELRISFRTRKKRKNMKKVVEYKVKDRVLRIWYSR